MSHGKQIILCYFSQSVKVEKTILTPHPVWPNCLNITENYSVISASVKMEFAKIIDQCSSLLWKEAGFLQFGQTDPEIGDELYELLNMKKIRALCNLYCFRTKR